MSDDLRRDEAEREELLAIAAESARDARDYITAYPLRTIGIAAFTGFVLGRMMR